MKLNFLFPNQAPLKPEEQTDRDDLVAYYNKVYKGQIRSVDSSFVQREQRKLEGCPSYQSYYAKCCIPHAMRNYKSDKSISSKITFVLWKMASGCDCLQECGYCQNAICEKCPVHMAANDILYEIENGLDKPEIIVKGKLTIKRTNNKTQVWFSEDNGRKPVEFNKGQKDLIVKEVKK